MSRAILQLSLPIILAMVTLPASSQTVAELQTFLGQNVGFTQGQITDMRNGKPVAKILPSRTPAEIFVVGAIYVNADPTCYVEFSSDYARLRKIPEYLAIREFSKPPQLSDLKDFGFDSPDVQALRNCKPGTCQLQLPGATINELHRSINWSASDVDDQVNRSLQKLALERLLAYQKEGNRIPDAVYNDKRKPTNVADQFQYMLSYSKALPEQLPDFYNYLVSYPAARPNNVQDTFYWDKVKFGLKPTLRIVHVVTMRGTSREQLAYAIAEKQLYSSHYFETALDLTFCIRNKDPKQPGFYLVNAMGSEQAGLTGLKGSIVRKVAADRSVSSLRESLAAIKNTLEQH